jgi:ribosomal-protein-serine acetyltransferase
VSRLPESVDGRNITLRLWRVADAARLGEAVARSEQHLRPWVAWMADEPRTPECRRARLARWESAWSAGGDGHYGVFQAGNVVGGGVLHRLGAGVLEVGYWTRAGLLRRGLASEAARALTDAAFSLPEINAVEIRHDKANAASSGVPRRLGYRLIGEQPNPAAAPNDGGVDLLWRMKRSEWSRPPGAT